MFRKPLMLAGLKKQRRLLETLLRHLETKNLLEVTDYLYCDVQAERVACNLRKLREIEKNYQDHLEPHFWLN